ARLVPDRPPPLASPAAQIDVFVIEKEVLIQAPEVVHTFPANEQAAARGPRNLGQLSSSQDVVLAARPGQHQPRIVPTRVGKGPVDSCRLPSGLRNWKPTIPARGFSFS